MDYRYSLKKGSRHEICPSCGKKTFKPYIEIATGKPAGAQYGRCERVNSCGYIKYPPTDRNNDYLTVVKPYVPPKPTEYINRQIVELTFNNFRENVFFMYLTKTFGRERAYELQSRYNIGTAKAGGTIFWQQDEEGRFRTGKVMYYHPTGKRDKTRSSWFVHKSIRPDFNFKQCFFGLHLIDGSQPVALCESEKTAVLMSVYEPEYVWIAAGGAEMLGAERMAELKRLDKVYPDHNQFEKWELRTRHFTGRQMDVTVDRAVESGLLTEGADILDLYNLKLMQA